MGFLLQLIEKLLPSLGVDVVMSRTFAMFLGIAVAIDGVHAAGVLGTVDADVSWCTVKDGFYSTFFTKDFVKLMVILAQ